MDIYNETTVVGFEAASTEWMSTTENLIRALTSIESSEDEISRFSRSLLSFAAVMTIIIMMVGIFGNLLTIIALLKCPKVRNVAAAFIISLCIADCLFCAVVLPFSAFRFIQGTWTHGDFLCKLIPFIQYGNIGVSLLCIAMITINRYIMIAHHSAYAKIYKRHWIGAMIAFCWLFSYGMQLPTLFGVWGTFGYDQKLGTCSIMNDSNGNSSKTALFIIAFVIPCIIIIGCYAKIFWVVHRSEARLRQHANKQNSIPNNLRAQMPSSTASNGTSKRVSSPPSSNSFSTTNGGESSKHSITQKSSRVKDQRDIKAKRNEWRITKMVLAIFLSFVICYLPITVVKVADKDVYSPGWHIFGYIMLYMSACINPIIYVIMNKQYRKAYQTVLMCQPSRLLPFTNAGSSAGEKWKDIGCSYNHSHTIVSQVSAVDQQTSSHSCSSIRSPVVLELSHQISQSTPNSTQISTSSHSPKDDPMKDTTGIFEPTSHNTKITMGTNLQNPPQAELLPQPPRISNNNNHLISDQNGTAKLSHPLQPVQRIQSMMEQQQQQPQLFPKPQDGTPLQCSSITLEGGDIILEEEEDSQTDRRDQTSSAIFPITRPEILDMTNNPFANLSIIQKDPQHQSDYSQNINVIPDRNNKVTLKSNVLAK